MRKSAVCNDVHLLKSCKVTVLTRGDDLTRPHIRDISPLWFVFLILPADEIELTMP
jgi:hypothetical protein